MRSALPHPVSKAHKDAFRSRQKKTQWALATNAARLKTGELWDKLIYGIQIYSFLGSNANQTEHLLGRIRRSHSNMLGKLHNAECNFRREALVSPKTRTSLLETKWSSCSPSHPAQLTVHVPPTNRCRAGPPPLHSAIPPDTPDLLPSPPHLTCRMRKRLWSRSMP